MNKTIEQLAEQVRAEWDKGNKIPYPEAHHAFQRDNDQKFAELIIQQCYQECNDQLLSNQIIGSERYTYNDGVIDCAVGILQRFGMTDRFKT